MKNKGCLVFLIIIISVLGFFTYFYVEDKKLVEEQERIAESRGDYSSKIIEKMAPVIKKSWASMIPNGTLSDFIIKLESPGYYVGSYRWFDKYYARMGHRSTYRIEIWAEGSKILEWWDSR